MRYVAAVMLVLGCAGPTEVECDVCITSAVVFGTVTDAAGQPASGLPIDIRLFADDCPGEMLRGGSDSAVPRTNATGQYEAKVISLWSPFTARCFQITANPDELTQWPTARFERAGILLLQPDTERDERDRLRLDIQLPASES